MFVSDTTEEFLDKVCVFTDDTKVCNRIDVPGAICNMENDMALLENGSKLCKLQFNLSKCNTMHLEKKNSLAAYSIWGTELDRTTEEKNLSMFIADDYKMSKQCG